MVELGNPKSHETMMGECDPNKIEKLLTTINNGEDIINWCVFFFIYTNIWYLQSLLIQFQFL